ncbi:MAG: IS21 family transposase, partial [Kangiellaceae bacterium]|nr:IS21 family transposase [Kangiellaceae bacterium]
MIDAHNLREVIRLLLLPDELSQNQIARLSQTSQSTVSEIGRRLIASDITLESLEVLDDGELKIKIYPKSKQVRRLKVEPDYVQIIKECFQAHKKYRKTIWQKYNEYKFKYGDRGYRRSRFYDLIKTYVKSTRLSMLQMFAPGEVMFIDYAGSTLNYKDGAEDKQANAFVATLGYSTKRFEYATKDMSALSWAEAIIAAMEFFGGVPEVVHCDNAKSMIKKPGLLPELNAVIKELSQHYSVHIDTSQVATPRHNALAENRVKELTHGIMAVMNTDLTFFSITDINSHLRKEVEKLNGNKAKKIGLSANDLFYSDERSQLLPLPDSRFEPTVYRSTVKVPENYFIYYKHNRYSVPHEYRNEHVEIRVKGNKLYIFHNGLHRVTHDIADGKNKIISIDKHLHPRHRAQKYKTRPHYLKWAADIDEQLVTLITLWYSKSKHDHSRPVSKQCQALQKLERRYG